MLVFFPIGAVDNAVSYVLVLCALHAFSDLTHWGLVTPYGVTELGQHWFRLRFNVWRLQART